MLQGVFWRLGTNIAANFISRNFSTRAGGVSLNSYAQRLPQSVIRLFDVNSGTFRVRRFHYKLRVLAMISTEL